VSWTVELARRFTRDFEALPQHVQQAVDRRLDQLASDPFQTDIRKLAGTNPETWRIRVGDYRILARFDRAAQVITLLRILHRREAYR
jgi:mRNA interferase RelE/StbE